MTVRKFHNGSGQIQFLFAAILIIQKLLSEISPP
jgi:hypothetical protein